MHRLVQLVVGIAGAVCMLAGLWTIRQPAQTSFWNRLFDTGHILVFGLIFVFLLWAVDALLPRVSRLVHYGISGFAAMALGLAVEIIHRFDAHRSAEWIDLFNDVVGVIALACLVAVIDPRLNETRNGLLKRRWLMGLAVVMLVAGLTPFLRVCAQYHTRNQLFPVLIEFDAPWYRHLCYASASRFQAVPTPKDWPNETHPQKLVARIDAHQSKYPGFVFSEPYPDWRGYRSLEVDVYLDYPEPRDFVLRVHDQQHDKTFEDRFNGVVSLQPGFQTVHFDLEDVKHGPRSRELQLSEVDGVAFFTVDLERQLTLYLGAMRLVK